MKFLVLVLGLALLAGPLAADPPSVMYRSLGSKPKSLDPAEASDATIPALVGQVCESLLQFSYLKRPYQVEPCLAAALPEVSADGLTYTFRIQQGVFFADDPCFTVTGGKGRELVAQDFVYAWKRLADAKRKSPGWGFFKDRIKGFNDFSQASGGKEPTDYGRPVAGLRTPDPSTLVIALTVPYPQLQYVLTMPYTAAFPREADDYYTDHVLEHPVGTGPFVLQAGGRGNKIIFVRNPRFRGEAYPSEGEAGDKETGLLADAGKPLPFLDRIEFSIIVETQPAWLEFLCGNFDISSIPKDAFDLVITGDQDLSQEMKARGIKLWKAVTLSVNYIGLNLEDPVLKNPFLRRALSLAFNFSARQKYLNHRLLKAYSPLPPILAGYNPALRSPYADLDLPQAKEFLSLAGYPGGRTPDGKPLTLTYEAGDTSTSTRQTLDLFTHDLKRLGVELEVNFNTWPAYRRKLFARQCQIWGSNWIGDYPDAENFLMLFYGPKAPTPNYTCHDNPRYNELFEKMRGIPDGPERQKIIDEMVGIINEACPWIYTGYNLSFVLQYDWVKNYKPHDVGYNTYKYYRLDEKGRAERKPRFRKQD